MSVLGNIGNAIVGSGEQALGAVSSLGGLAPNTFATAATNAGHNITNPGVNILGNINPGYTFSGPAGIVPNSTFQPATSQQKVQADTGTTSTTGTVTGGATAGSATAGSSVGDAYKQAYDSYINSTQSHIDQQPLLQQSAEQAQSGVYGGQQGLLDQQHQAGTASNAFAQQNLNDQKTRSLRDLNNSLQGQVQGYNNQLGTYGAGDSSASQMLNYALGRQNDQQRNDLLQQAGSQQTGIDLQKKNLDDAYGTQTTALEGAKQATINQIRTQYGTQMQQLQDTLKNYTGQEAIYLAYNGQNQASQDALSKLAALDSLHSTNQDALQLAYQNYVDPRVSQADISKYMQAPTAQSLVTQQPGQFDLSGATSQNYSPQYIPVNLKRTTDPTSQY